VVQTTPEQTLIAHTPEAAPAERRRLADAGVQLLETAAGADGRVELHQLVEQLARRDVAALLVEGGAAVHGSFADAGLVDETVFLIAPLLIGGGGPSAIAGRGVADLELATRLRFEGVERHGADIELRAVRPEDEDVHGSD
jgi:diaminohydroxyphosphoribosylaminopyrimidine deaminase/5-amino-6-(5-phosphoribosylamino)uracil reductase